MRLVLADTSALVAMRDSADAHHHAALEWFREASAEGVRLVVTNYILAEVHAFFCRWPDAALGYADKIRTDPAFKVVRASAADEAEAWAILHRSHDKTYSFVDAVSFAVMKSLRLNAALAFDQHFRQFGRCTVLP